MKAETTLKLFAGMIDKWGIENFIILIAFSMGLTALAVIGMVVYGATIWVKKRKYPNIIPSQAMNAHTPRPLMQSLNQGGQIGVCQNSCIKSEEWVKFRTQFAQDLHTSEKFREQMEKYCQTIGQHNERILNSLNHNSGIMAQVGAALTQSNQSINNVSNTLLSLVNRRVGD